MLIFGSILIAIGILFAVVALYFAFANGGEGEGCGCLLIFLTFVFLGIGFAITDSIEIEERQTLYERKEKECRANAKFSVGQMVHIKGFTKLLKITEIECISESHRRYEVIDDTGTESRLLEEEIEKDESRKLETNSGSTGILRN